MQMCVESRRGVARGGGGELRHGARAPSAARLCHASRHVVELRHADSISARRCASADHDALPAPLPPHRGVQRAGAAGGLADQVRAALGRHP